MFPLVTAGAGASHIIHGRLQSHASYIRDAQERMQLLNENPLQYTLFFSRAGSSGFQIREDLLSFGQRWEGYNFAKPDNFGVNTHYHLSEIPWKNRLGIKERTCSLSLYSEDPAAELSPETSPFDESRGSLSAFERKAQAEQPARAARKNTLGRRGGYTPPPELEEVTGDVEHLTTSNQPNLSSDISEEYVEGLSPRQPDRVFTFSNPEPTNPIWFYLFGIGLAVGCTFLFAYLQAKFSKWTSLKDLLHLGSTPDENPSAKRFKRPIDEDQMLKIQRASQTKATPEVLLKTFESSKKGAITKKGATFLLITYYNLSEAEALGLLKEE